MGRSTFNSREINMMITALGLQHVERNASGIRKFVRECCVHIHQTDAAANIHLIHFVFRESVKMHVEKY